MEKLPVIFSKSGKNLCDIANIEPLAYIGGRLLGE
jgi:hypothetical protein